MKTQLLSLQQASKLCLTENSTFHYIFGMSEIDKANTIPVLGRHALLYLSRLDLILVFHLKITNVNTFVNMNTIKYKKLNMKATLYCPAVTNVNGFMSIFQDLNYIHKNIHMYTHTIFYLTKMQLHCTYCFCRNFSKTS